MKTGLKNIHLASLFITLFALSSCVEDVKVMDNFLDKAPGVDIDIDQVFSKAETSRYALWNVYSDMYFGFNTKQGSTIDYGFDGGMFESLSDSHQSAIGYDAAGTTYYPGIYNVKYEDDGSLRCKFPFKKARVWECVRAAWIFIENINRVPDMDDAEKQRLTAEAKIIIASRYFDMFRHFGGLPLIDHAQDMTVVSKGNPRATVEETVNFMVRLLDEAASTPSLPWALSENEVSTWAGRLTKASAMGLKCKILLFAASPLFNDAQPYCTEEPQEAVTNKQVWYGGYKPELWQQCRKACEDFFAENEKNGNPYHLVQPSGNMSLDVENVNNPYRLAFRNSYLYRESPELIITVHCDKYLTNYMKYDNTFIFSDRSMKGSVCPTQELADRFTMKDGTPAVFDGLYEKNNPKDINPYADRDPRFYETLLCNGSPWRGGNAELWEGGYMQKNNSGQYIDKQETKNGYGLFKFITDRKISSNIPLQYPYLRLPELYLIYAEALAETGDLANAINQVNIIRSRVGLSDLNACNPTLNLKTNKANLIKEILRERSCELTLEDVRFFDMIRRKLVDDFTKPLHGIKIYRKDGKNQPWKGTSDEKNKVPFPTKFWYESVTLPQRYWQTPGGFSTKWFLSAIPSSEINKDYGMTQNPGW